MKWHIKTAFLMIFAVLFLPIGLHAQDSGSDGEIEALQEQIEILRQQMEELTQESEVRKELESTQEEKSEEESEILSSAGRRYTLMPSGSLEFSYSLGYSYTSSDEFRSIKNSDLATFKALEKSTHSLTNSVDINYGFFNNLTVNMGIPFVYAFSRTSTDNAVDVTDLGDVSFGIQFQPFKAGGKLPTTIANANFHTRTGRSPYETVPNKDLGTGSGYYSVSGGFSMSKIMDPAYIGGSLSYRYAFDVDGLEQNYTESLALTEIETGDSASAAIQLGYALSYKLSMIFAYSCSYSFASVFHYKNIDKGYRTGSQISASLSIGAQVKVTPKRRVTFTITNGLTNSGPDFAFNIRMPWTFQ